MNNNLIVYNKFESKYDVSITRKKGLFNRPRLFFNDSNNKLLGFFDINDKIYDFGNKCFTLKTNKIKLFNGFQFNFTINFIDNKFYADMNGYLARNKNKKYIKGSFISEGEKYWINSRILSYCPNDCKDSKKNLQFLINNEAFFKLYKTKSGTFKLVYDKKVNRHTKLLILMITSCLFID